jgi:hypothetical protein
MESMGEGGFKGMGLTSFNLHYATYKSGRGAMPSSKYSPASSQYTASMDKLPV